MPTNPNDVAWLLEVMSGCGIEPIVVGGWGVDALAGEQSRPHRDLDVLVQHEFVETISSKLLSAGFAVATDWLPVRVELSDVERDRHVDIHPIFDDGRGGWWQHGRDDTKFEYPAAVLTTGLIGAVPVQCLTAAKQRDLHAGYELREQDAHDLGVLDVLPSPIRGGSGRLNLLVMGTSWAHPRVPECAGRPSTGHPRTPTR